MCVTTSKSLLQVNVDSVTGRDDSLIDSLDFCYEISSILGEGEMPVDIFADEGLSEEVFERTESVHSGSIICETLTILVKRTSDTGN